MTTPAARVSVHRAGSSGRDDAATNVCFTIGTLVNDHAQYAAMRASFEAGGFGGDCEFLYIDNTQSHQTGAYAGLNAILDAARAPVVILCHQDVRLLDDQRQDLDNRLNELHALDPSWAVAGNAGGISPGRLALRITDPHGPNQSRGSFPSRVSSLDENFLIVRRASRIGFSHDLDGFHLYGADLCLHAAQMGCSCYVIDFHLEHLSPGHKSAAFFAAEQAFVQRWSKALRPRWLQTTCTLMRITANPVRSRAGRGIDRLAAKIARRISARQTNPQAVRDMT